MKNFLKENWFKTLIAFAAILSGVAFCWYLVSFLPRQELAEFQQRNSEVFRQECKNERLDDFKFFDKSGLSPELVQIGLKNKGYVDDFGKFIDDDIWMKGCVGRKLNVWMQ